MPSRAALAIVAVALASLSTAAALGLGRVFESGRFVLPVLGAVLVVHGIGAIARARNLSALDVVALWAAALAAYLIWALAPQSTFFGIPTADTLTTLADRLGDGFDELRNAIVPAPATDGAILLAVVAVWMVAASAEILAFWRRAAIAAVAPALALFIWTAALGTDSSGTLSTLAFATAALAYLLLAQQAAMTSGRTRFAGRQLGVGTGLVGVGTLLGAIALVAGLLVGSALPGADAEPLLDLQGLGKKGSTPDSRSYRTEPPLARIGEDLTQQEPVDLFTVTAAQPEYWRIAALDEYQSTNGGEWTLTAAGSGEVVEGLDAKVSSGDLEQSYVIDKLDGRWVPAAYEPVRIEGTTPLVVKASTTLVTGRNSLRGVRYTVSSKLPPGAVAAITPAQSAATSAPVPRALRRYETLPSEFPQDVRDLAARVTEGKRTPYERAQALERFFLDPTENFTYSLQTDLSATAQSQSAISEFLKPGNRAGFCVQFAGSYAAMARAIGLPARVAVGFTPGALDPVTGQYTVTSYEAHAWPEVYLSGLGWIRFEPTPTSNAPGGSDLPNRAPTALPDTTTAPGTATATTVPGEQSGPGTDPGTATTVPGSRGADVRIDTDDAKKDGDGGILPGWEFLVWLLVALVIATAGGAIAILLAKARLRRQRRTRDDPAEAIAGAWQEVIERLGEAGIRHDLARTPLELAIYAPPLLPDGAAEPLTELARAYSASEYGRQEPDDELAGNAWRYASEVSAALNAGASVRERWRRRLDPTPLRR